MTPLPKRKHTKSRTGKRRAQKGISLPALVRCKECGKLKYPHKACPHCGKK